MFFSFPGRVIIFILLYMTPTLVKAMSIDTIPPFIVVKPEDQSVDCEEDYIPVLESWYNNYAGLEAFEPNGLYTKHCIYTLTELDSLLNLSKDTICDNAALLPVGFFALDTCLNSSDTLYANFSIFDDEKPVIFKAAETVSYDCDFGILDSLNNWLNNHGGAIAMDNCGDTVIWNNYFWSDSEGNSGFVEAGDPSNIVIQRSKCDWSLNVSFFVIDPCGNANVSNGNFSLTGDDTPPTLIMALPDTTLECSNLPFIDQPIFEDGCDGIMNLSLSETSTQDPDSTKCEHYNYQLTRIWTATDACDNSASSTHIINVQDTEAPIVDFENLKLVDCDVDIFNDLSGLIQVTENCGLYEVEYNDVVVSFSDCQQEYDRGYTVTDVCGNSFNFSQSVQVQDLSTPEVITEAQDVIFYCDGNNDIEALFQDWIENNGMSEVSDNCNEINNYARLPGTYTLADVQSIVTADPAEIDKDNCLRNSMKEIVRQDVDFIFIDECNNISISSALFTVIDTLAPIINFCNEDLNITLKSNRCDTILPLPVPNADDICDLYGKLFFDYSVVLNNGLRVDYVNSITENISFEVGEHSLEYLVFDCAGNSASCIQKINIYEEVPPVINCPSDQTITVPIGACTAEVVLSDDYTIDENCQTTFTFEDTQPTGPGYVAFFYDQDIDTFVANSIFLGYMNLEILGSLSEPSLELFFAGDTDANDEFFILYSEVGENLGNIQFSNANCNNTASVIVDLDVSDFLRWAENGTVFFTLTPNDENTDGINPCIELSENGTDELSFLRATLRYNDVHPEVKLKDIQGNELSVGAFTDTLTLDVGLYNVEYTITDASGNRDSCDFSLFVEDEEPPVIDCLDNDTLFIEPSLFGLTLFKKEDFNILSSDNCGISEYNFIPETVDCSLFGQASQVRVEAIDFYDNISECNTNIVVAPVPLELDFSSGLCIDDTLKLFSNLEFNDVFNVLQYNWTGPNGFQSNKKEPSLEITNQNIGGFYELELTDAIGCKFYGSIEIEIQALNSPEIFANQQLLCEGESLLLNSTSFTESVNYLWYEGVSPNGVLLLITAGPSLQINPTPGTHFYYVDIEGEDCNTNESATLQVEVETTPTAKVLEPFITVCEGENIVLGAEDTPNGSTYSWVGPAGYESTGQFPDVIPNATGINDGSYALIVNRNGCVSDTAFTQVVVFPQPLKPLISGESAFCEGANFVLSVNNVQTADQYNWYLDGVLMNSLSSNNLIIPTAQSSLEGDWTVIVQDGLCFSESSNAFNVSINPEINIGANNNGPICNGDSVMLSSSFIPDASYSWLSPSGDLLNGRNHVVLAESGTYNLTVTTASNCSNVASTTVEILEVPRITALSNSSITCMNKENTVLLVPTVFPPGNYDYSWTGPNNFSSDQESPSLKNITEEDNGSYILVISDGSCSSTPKSTDIQIEIKPDKPELFLTSNSCVDDSLVLQVFSPFNDGQYFWNTPKGLFQNNNSTFKIANADASDNGFYSVSVRRGSCTSVRSDSLLISLTPKVMKPIISGVNQLCENEDLVLTADFVDNASYTWVGPNGNIAQNTQQIVIPQVGTNDAGAYHVIRMLDQCQSDVSLPYSINVIPTPEAPSFELDTIELCYGQGQNLEICLLDNPETNEIFQLIDNQEDTIISSTSTSCFNVFNLDEFDFDEIVFTARRRKNGCFSNTSDEIRIIKYNVPEFPASFLSDSIFVCGDDQIQIQIDNPNNYEIELVIDDPGAEIDFSDQTISISSLTSLESTIVINSSFALCDNFGTDEMTILNAQEIAANNDELVMDFNATEQLDFLANDIYSNEISIDILEDSGLDLSLSEDQELIIIADNKTTGQREIIYEICIDNCSELCDLATITLDIGNDEDCFIANLITPNNDGINDVFLVPCLGSGNYPDNELIIFNQWGGEVFSASPYENNWNAIYKGDDLPSGTYYYQLKISDDREIISGFIVIER